MEATGKLGGPVMAVPLPFLRPGQLGQRRHGRRLWQPYQAWWRERWRWAGETFTWPSQRATVHLLCWRSPRRRRGGRPGPLRPSERMHMEKQAIALIISLEPKLNCMPDGNAGFDLFEKDAAGQQTRWVEVKSMTGTLKDRPVGLSHTQFRYASEHGSAYWLYVVENAIDRNKARVLRIQNPSPMPERSLSTMAGARLPSLSYQTE